MSRKSIDLTRQKFGKLTALKPTESRTSKGCVIWQCVCDCGQKVFASSDNLRSGNTKSCGCLVEKGKITHGMSKTPIYKIWADMINRCKNRKHKAYKNYGGRGIQVCKRWYRFENFYEDMGDRPESLSMDRKNNNGNYESGNCRWATCSEQSNNSRPISHGSRPQYWFRAINSHTREEKKSNNQHEFARKYSLNPRGISACLLGKRKFHKGWMFARIEPIS